MTDKKRFLSHDALNSIAASLGVALAILSLGLQLRERSRESVERVIVQPSISPHRDLEIGVINASRRDIWVRYIIVRFFDSKGAELNGHISIKPPPEDAVPLVPKQLEAFRTRYQLSQVPKQALYGEIAVGTTLNDITGLYVEADFFRDLPKAYGRFSRRDGGTLWRIPGPEQVLQVSP